MTAIGIAGAVAIGANIGILDAAGASTTGNLSAAGDLVAPATEVIDSVALADGTTQEFAVDVAGTVSVSRSDQGVRLESATPAAGWSWSLAQPGPNDLTVTFTDGARTLEFTASVTSDGNIAAGVSEPMVQPATAPSGGRHDDDDDEHEEYEGGEDDD